MSESMVMLSAGMTPRDLHTFKAVTVEALIMEQH